MTRHLPSPRTFLRVIHLPDSNMTDNDSSDSSETEHKKTPLRLKKSTPLLPLVIDGDTGVAVPTPRRMKINLHSIIACRREMAKLYRDARNGNLPSNEASKLIYCLSVI